VLHAVCDVDVSALKLIKQAYPDVKTTVDLDELLQGPDEAVIIATPAHLHGPMCLKAISAGKHVFVEKPLALTVSEGREIAAAADREGVRVFVGHLLLYHPAVTRLRSLIASGAIGRVWHLRSRRLSLGKLRSHENVWWSFAPHDVALMLAIMREKPRSVTAMQTAFRDEAISDIAYADFEFQGGRSAHLEVCWSDPDKTARLDVFGTEGVLTLTDSRGASSLSLKTFTVSKDGNGKPVITRGTEQMLEYEGSEPLKAELLAFIDSIRTGVPAETDVHQGVAVLEALAMADEAACYKAASLEALA
jgi:UDP-2-acetamido-3-amino-2,3-dideoxy-glucuronate N-acetyltransferase